jgi:hypothetical protein
MRISGKPDLTGAVLAGTNLGNTDLSFANLAWAIYEPATNPPAPLIATASGLGHLQWVTNPGPVYALRKSLFDQGFEEAGRQITAAIHRQNTRYRIEEIIFDWTCAWGADYLRPLELAAALAVICTVLYWVGLHFDDRRSGLYLVATGQRVGAGV